MHRFCLQHSRGGNRSCYSPRLGSIWTVPVPSLAPFFSSSALRSNRVTGLLRCTTATAVISTALTAEISPGKVQNLIPLVPPGSTVRVLMTFGLRCSQPARRPRPASLPVRIPTVESLLSASFSFTSRLRLAVRYGYRHRFRLAPFIQLDSAHAGHTGAGNPARRRLSAGPGVST